jgi:hypothetical protein
VNTSVPATRPFAVTVAVAALATSALGCGTGKNYANNPRPAEPIVVAAAITPNGISVSPPTFGAGLVQLVVTNLTTSSQQLEIYTGAGTARHSVLQQIGPINPQDTAQVKLQLGTGAYSVRVNGRKVKDAVVKVGAPRPTSQNQLLQP